MKRSVDYSTGKVRLTAESVTGVPSFTEFAQQELGVGLPIGKGRRAGWMKFCKEEMLTQGWTPLDLANTVLYVKAARKQCHNVYGLLFWVSDAKRWAAARDTVDVSSLHAKVAVAIQSETDEDWVRKLSLARGKSLELVYENWLNR